jgi:hypothetical protein
MTARVDLWTLSDPRGRIGRSPVIVAGRCETRGVLIDVCDGGIEVDDVLGGGGQEEVVSCDRDMN